MHGSAHSRARRESVQPSLDGLQTVPERPRLKNRTNSAPLVETRRTALDQHGGPKEGSGHGAAETAAKSPTGAAVVDGQDEDEVAGVVGAVRQYQPFQSPEISEPIPEINIAVVGAPGVGKSTFVQKALDLPALPQSQAAERKIPQDGASYLVRLLEVPIDDVDFDDDDNSLVWPDTIENKVMPVVDGAITLYDVQDKNSFEDIPRVLNAIRRSSLPSVLISTKCDTPIAQRELDPVKIERGARNSIGGIGLVQTSAHDAGAEKHKEAVAMILKQIIFGKADEQARSASVSRKRAQSTAVRPVSPRPPSGRGHARASSEYTGSLHKAPSHGRHDSSLAAYNHADRLRNTNEVSQEEMHRSFLLEESGSESLESARSSFSTEVIQQGLGGASTVPTVSENGATFDELVDRLLARPTSKADSKFSAIFLALYRKFAAPGRLLEAIVQRFEALDRAADAQMIKTISQMRYLGILEQWLSQYPGDFAHSKTKRRIRTLVAKISQVQILKAAANEMSSHLEMVQDDDDTNWAFSDTQWEMHPGDRISTGSTASTLIDDPAYCFVDDISSTVIGEDATRSSSTTSIASSQFIATAREAQRVACSLQPMPRKLITKLEWRTLMEIPDDLIAKELTRMDWIMFSSIRPRDLVRQLSSAEKARCRNLVHVARMIDHFNHTAAWVSNYILFRDKPKHRALMTEKMMRIGRKLRELNNYNGVGAIIAGIKSTAVSRLSLTKELIPEKVGRDWARLEILMSHSRSFAAYRLAWENTSCERIPYLPLHLRDLATAEQGNPTFIGDEKDGKINWKKFEIMGEVVVSMQRAQGMPYRGLGKGEAMIKELILDVKLEKDDDALFERSVLLEPMTAGSGTSEKFKQFFKR